MITDPRVRIFLTVIHILRCLNVMTGFDVSGLDLRVPDYSN